MDFDNIKKLVGTRIRQLRTELGLTQQEFSKKIGIKAATLSAYEKGDNTPSAEKLYLISKEFNTSIDWLFGIDAKNEKNNYYSDIVEKIISITLSSSVEITNIVRGGESFLDLILSDTVIQCFLRDWRGMLKLYQNKTIDFELLNPWIEKQLERYHFKIGWDDYGQNADLEIFLEELNM